VTVKRLRPMPTAEEMAAMYPAPHDHRIYGRGHHERVEATVALAVQQIADAERQIVADLSCGNGDIARRIATSPAVHLGDFAAGWEYHGPLEETLDLIPLVDVYVCSETIEHLDDPFDVLLKIRHQAERLVLSTPIGCWDDANGEHLWAWDREGVEQLLDSAGWSPWAFTNVDSTAYGEPYNYGIWVAV